MVYRKSCPCIRLMDFPPQTCYNQWTLVRWDPLCAYIVRMVDVCVRLSIEMNVMWLEMGIGLSTKREKMHGNRIHNKVKF